MDDLSIKSETRPFVWCPRSLGHLMLTASVDEATRRRHPIFPPQAYTLMQTTQLRVEDKNSCYLKTHSQWPSASQWKMCTVVVLGRPSPLNRGVYSPQLHEAISPCLNNPLFFSFPSLFFPSISFPFPFLFHAFSSRAQNMSRKSGECVPNPLAALNLLSGKVHNKSERYEP